MACRHIGHKISSISGKQVGNVKQLKRGFDGPIGRGAESCRKRELGVRLKRDASMISNYIRSIRSSAISERKAEYVTC
jgi:hypothetical protein